MQEMQSMTLMCVIIILIKHILNFRHYAHHFIYHSMETSKGSTQTLLSLPYVYKSRTGIQGNAREVSGVQGCPLTWIWPQSLFARILPPGKEGDGVSHFLLNCCVTTWETLLSLRVTGDGR